MDVFQSIWNIFRSNEDIEIDTKNKIKQELSRYLDKYIPTKGEYTKKMNDPKSNNMYIIFHIDCNNTIHFKHYKTSKKTLKLNDIIFTIDHVRGNIIDVKNKIIGTKCIVEMMMEKIKYIPEIVKTSCMDGRIFSISLTK